MDKIKVSKEIGKALDLAIKFSGKKGLLDAHTGIGCWTIKEYMPLNKLSNWELAEILFYGYEVEESPEEKLLKYYEYSKDMADKSESQFCKGYWEGVSEGVFKSLNFKKEKIKGINSPKEITT